MNGVPIDIHACVTRLAKFSRPHLVPRFETAFDGIHRVAIGLAEGFSRGDAAGNGWDLAVK